MVEQDNDSCTASWKLLGGSEDVLLCAIATYWVVDCTVSADMHITCLKAQEIHVWPKVRVWQQSIQLAPVESTPPQAAGTHTHTLQLAI
jgi:hypothetical protein